jgi:hypothetical protein
MMQDIRAEHTGVPINSRQLDQGGRLRTPGRAGEPSRLVQRAASGTHQANGRITKMPLPWSARCDSGGDLGRRTV